MERQSVAGIGGIVLFADHADTLAHWYEKHLGLHFTREPDTHFWWVDIPGTAFAIHQTTHPLTHDRRHVEITWRVTCLDAFIEQLGEFRVSVDEPQGNRDGDFAWLDDPEGNRIELYQQPE